MLSDWQVLQTLAKAPLFHGVEGSHRLKLLTNATQKRHGKGCVVFEEGAEGDQLFVLAKGTVRVVRSSARGNVVELTRKHALAVFGELAVIDNGVRSATVETVTVVDLIVISRDVVFELLDTSSEFRVAFISHLVRTIRRTTESEVDRAFLDLKTRVAKQLLELTGGGEVAPILRAHVTKVQLAQMVGATRQRVHAVLRTLAAEGLVGIDSTGIDVLDCAGLEALAVGG